MNKHECEICGESYDFRGQALACKSGHERERKVDEISKKKPIDYKTGRIYG